jgi:alginate O-acetyltransferase complex protein AlgI
LTARAAIDKDRPQTYTEADRSTTQPGSEMVFNSLTFLLFFAVVLGVNRLPLPWTGQKLFLLVASYVFYAAWNPPFVILLWITTVVDWFAARQMPRARSHAARRGLLMLSLVTNFGLLGFFKYGGFLLESCVRVLAVLGIAYRPAGPDIILPAGISFYTFQTLSYTIDVYRGRLQPCRRFLDLAFFVTFFPQLVAGPILRAADFLPQCVEPRRGTARQIGWGLSLLVLGLFEKVILADNTLARVADQVYANVSKAGWADAWLGTLAFSGQIFFDFAGYSTCAIGAALCLGFVIQDNFRFPYGAVGFSDFWRRWHVSLSSWLRDYLYISLGGNRRGTARTYANLIVTMLLGGLWHGASWRFVAWGGLHGAYLAVERFIRGRRGTHGIPARRLPRIALVLVTYFFICISWVFFRAQDFPSAFTLATTMFVGRPDRLSLSATYSALVVGITVWLLATHWLMRDSTEDRIWSRFPWWLRSVLLAAMLIALALNPGEDRVFIYFQF